MTQAEERLSSRVKDKLAKGEPVYSMTVRLVRGVEIGAVAKAAGFDAIYIDLEHSGLSIETAGQISIASLAMGVDPFVRVPGVDPHVITRVLDAGAIGIIVPGLESAEDARTAVNAARYRPEGERSLPGVMPQLGFRALSASMATAELNQAITVVAMIESAAGLAAVHEIAAVPGIDILLVGANDLCTEAGIPGQFESEFVEAAYRRTLDACREHGKTLGVGGLASRPDLMKKYVAMGGRYVSLGADISLLVAAARRKRQEVE